MSSFAVIQPRPARAAPRPPFQRPAATFGAALIGQGRFAEGVAEIDKGLALNPTEPEKAYFNRAVAEERLGDLKSAYNDYRKAQELKPDWPLPQTELARFRVRAP